MNQSAESRPEIGQCRRSLCQCWHWGRVLMEMITLKESTYSLYKRLVPCLLNGIVQGRFPPPPVLEGRELWPLCTKGRPN
jgi:hypothetical protein